jgi:HKD family nuclease
MKSQILSRLHDIEAEENIRIAYACDAGQTQMLPTLKPYLTKGKTLYFSLGFP